MVYALVLTKSIDILPEVNHDTVYLGEVSRFRLTLGHIALTR